MQNVYNLSLPGPTGGHVMMNKIYENILPGKENKMSSTTLGERLIFADYIRQVMVKINEGEEINIATEGHNSIMNYIKFMELNPNHYSVTTNNPYSSLPKGLLIYRSCFPIQVGNYSSGVECGKNAMGLNMRLYSLSIAEYYSYIWRRAYYVKYDVWRELAYYKYMRDNVVKKKQSPNFVLMYAFFMAPNNAIDYYNLKKDEPTEKQVIAKEYSNFLKDYQAVFDIVKSKELADKLKDAVVGASLVPDILPDEENADLQAYSGTTMILMTEAPHHNLYQWASRTYEKEGIVQKMISHGYHDKYIWFGVLFQIVSALYVMQLHGIYIRDMTIADNVFIKDLQNKGNIMGYWRYIIDGISYYIPNFGYMVYIDSNFKEVPVKEGCDTKKRSYKICCSNDMFNCHKYPVASIRHNIFGNFRNIINTNSFTKEHTLNGLNRPPIEVTNLIDIMTADNSSTNIGYFLQTYFRMFMNNRIGTLLKKEEVQNIRDINVQFKEGDMAIEDEGQNIYRWCMVKSVGDAITIITHADQNNNDFIEKTVPFNSLKQYSVTEKIEQINVNDINLSDESLLETYIIDKYDY